MTNFVDDCFSIRIHIYNISAVNYNIRSGILNISEGSYIISVGDFNIRDGDYNIGVVRCGFDVGGYIFSNVKYNIADGVYNTRDGDCNIRNDERINIKLFLFKFYSKQKTTAKSSGFSIII